jgi:predicted alpha/beta-fold hydrolase
MVESNLFKSEYISNDSKTLIVLLSGFSGGLKTPLVRDLSRFLYKNNDIVLINFCNDKYFRSLSKQESLSFKDYVSILWKVLNNINYKKYERVKLVGHSFSALIVEEFLLDKGEKFSNAIPVFIDPTFYEWIKEIEKFGFYLPDTSRFYLSGNLKVSKDLVNYVRKNSKNNFSNHGKLLIVRSEVVEKIAGDFYKKVLHSKIITLEKTGHYFSGYKNRKKLSEIINELK